MARAPALRDLGLNESLPLILLPPPKARAGELLIRQRAKKLGVPVIAAHRAVLTQKLDHNRLPKLLHPGNEHALIYMWGTTGLAYNVDKVKERLPDAPADSWALLFDPANAAKLADCGIMALDAPVEVMASALRYLGEDPDSKDPAVLEKGAALLEQIRPYIRKFHSSEYINALANGDVCLALGWSGDAGIAKTRAEEASNGVRIEYTIPKEGALLWFDMMAMPTDAPDPEAGYAFLSYLLEPEVMAKISNFVTYPNAVPASYALIDPEVKGDPSLFPTPEIKEKLFTVTPFDQKGQRTLTRLWTRLLTGG